MFSNLVYVPLLLTALLIGLLTALEGDGVVRLVMLAVVLAVSVFLIRQIFRAVDFYERAAVDRLFWWRRVFQYDQVKALNFDVTPVYARSNFSDVYSHHQFHLRLEMTDGRNLVIGGVYRGAMDIVELRSVIEAKMAAATSPPPGGGPG